DGPGLTAEQMADPIIRGRRLDETKPGSGLGLSIVVDLATLYGGKLVLGTAPIGGLRAELVLPAA
ncbi:MAG TPA: sensor histidine kinase, partial [Xanthobacteraceae bacterium]|nr:sensor histidine kinase [Xanthobacteraceae bacterium]